MEMFHRGPAFTVINNDGDAGLSIREAFFQNKYEIRLGTMNQEDISWKLDDENKSFHDNFVGRTYLVGFDPEKLLLEHLTKTHHPTKEEYHQLLKDCFLLKTWPKTAEEVLPLPVPRRSDGAALYHGAILDFDKIPIRYHNKSALDFWLQNRQVKVPSNLPDVRNMVQILWDKFTEKFFKVLEFGFKG